LQKTISSTINPFRSSNSTRHYHEKHPEIAISLLEEKEKKTLVDLTSAVINKSNQTSIQPYLTFSNKRQRTSYEYSNDEVFNKIISFLLQNNLAFRVVTSESFKDLLYYLDNKVPIINRKKIAIKVGLLYKQQNEFLKTQLLSHIDALGFISIQLDIWTVSTGFGYLGVIGSWINTDF
jgi:beta-N-acetylglucosaminidase